MIDVIISSEVADYLDELAYKLYLKGYFGFIETAIEYVDKLTDDVHQKYTYQAKKTCTTTIQKIWLSLHYL